MYYLYMIYIIELNIEFALKLKEKIRTTLDDKELESFARQIASGMVNFLHNTLFLELLVEGFTPGKKYIEIARGKCPDFRECIK